MASIPLCKTCGRTAAVRHRYVYLHLKTVFLAAVLRLKNGHYSSVVAEHQLTPICTKLMHLLFHYRKISSDGLMIQQSVYAAAILINVGAKVRYYAVVGLYVRTCAQQPLQSSPCNL